MSSVRLVYWAGARAAAGVETETWPATTVSGALEAARASRENPEFDRVIRLCAVLVDGVTVRGDDLDRPLSEDTEVQLLPPYAGGSCDFSSVRRKDRAETRT